MPETSSAMLTAAPYDDDDDPVGQADGALKDRLLVPGVAALCAGIPLAVALGVMAQPRWYPSLDMALIELRVRDVGTPDRPLVGLAGRIHGHDVYGSHPGPLHFWLLWPFYKLYGGTAWALQAAAATLNLIAAGLALWMAKRRGGLPAVCGVAVALTLLMRAYGFEQITVPWNPYLPMLWWVVFLLAVWSILSHDLVMVPVAVVAGCICAQTHIPYVPLVTGVAGVAAVAAVARTVRGPRSVEWRRLAVWTFPAVGLLVVLWLPPIIEQSRPGIGNLSIIWDAFAHPDAPRLGIGGDAFRFWFGYLDVWGLLRPYEATGPAQDGSMVPGILLLLVWLGAVVVAWRLRHRDLLTLHLVVGAALACGYVAITRIHGVTWFWLFLWGWGTTTLLMIAVGWTVAAGLRGTAWISWVTPRWGLAAVVAASALLTLDATGAQPEPMGVVPDSQILAHVAPPTIQALQAGELPGTGPDGRYLVVFYQDPFTVGATGQGLVLELERQGLDVGITEPQAVAMGEHRLRSPAESTAVVHQVVGDRAIEGMRERPGATRVALYDPRGPQDRARFERDYAAVVERLQEIGRDDSARALAGFIVSVALDQSLPQEIREDVGDLLTYPQPTAVFVTPPA